MIYEIQKFGEKHKYSSKVLDEADQIAEKVNGQFQRKDSKGVYAASLYLAARKYNERGWKYTQRYIAFEMDVSEVTIRKRFQELVTLLDIKLGV